MLCSIQETLLLEKNEIAIYLKDKEMLSQNGYQESDMYSTKQLPLESQTFFKIQSQHVLGVYVQQITRILCSK